MSFETPLATWTLLMVRPSTNGRRPRRIVSTSGSSGMLEHYAVSSQFCPTFVSTFSGTLSFMELGMMVLAMERISWSSS